MLSTLLIVLFLLFVFSAVLGAPRLFTLARTVFRNIAGFSGKLPAENRPVDKLVTTAPQHNVESIFDERGVRLDPVAFQIVLTREPAGPETGHDLSKISSVHSETVNGADRVAVEITDPERVVRHVPFFTRKAADEFAQRLKQAIVSAGGPRLG